MTVKYINGKFVEVDDYKVKVLDKDNNIIDVSPEEATTGLSSGVYKPNIFSNEGGLFLEPPAKKKKQTTTGPILVKGPELTDKLKAGWKLSPINAETYKARTAYEESEEARVSREDEFNAVAEEQRQYGGTLNTIRSAGYGALRGLTFGGSDVIARAFGDESDIEYLNKLRAYHPYASFGGELAGGIVGGLATGGVGLAGKALTGVRAIEGAGLAARGGASILRGAGHGMKIAGGLLGGNLIPTSVKAGRTAKAATSLANLAITGGTYGVTYKASEAALDPEMDASKFLASTTTSDFWKDIGKSAAVGVGLGVGIGGLAKGGRYLYNKAVYQGPLNKAKQSIKGLGYDDDRILTAFDLNTPEGAVARQILTHPTEVAKDIVGVTRPLTQELLAVGVTIPGNFAAASKKINNVKYVAEMLSSKNEKDLSNFVDDLYKIEEVYNSALLEVLERAEVGNTAAIRSIADKNTAINKIINDISSYQRVISNAESWASGEVSRYNAQADAYVSQAQEKIKQARLQTLLNNKVIDQETFSRISELESRAAAIRAKYEPRLNRRWMEEEELRNVRGMGPPKGLSSEEQAYQEIVKKKAWGKKLTMYEEEIYNKYAGVQPGVKTTYINVNKEAVASGVIENKEALAATLDKWKSGEPITSKEMDLLRSAANKYAGGDLKRLANIELLGAPQAPAPDLSRSIRRVEDVRYDSLLAERETLLNELDKIAETGTVGSPERMSRFQEIKDQLRLNATQMSVVEPPGLGKRLGRKELKGIRGRGPIPSQPTKPDYDSLMGRYNELIDKANSIKATEPPSAARSAKIAQIKAQSERLDKHIAATFDVKIEKALAETIDDWSKIPGSGFEDLAGMDTKALAKIPTFIENDIQSAANPNVVGRVLRYEDGVPATIYIYKRNAINADKLRGNFNRGPGGVFKHEAMHLIGADTKEYASKLVSSTGRERSIVPTATRPPIHPQEKWAAEADLLSNKYPKWSSVHTRALAEGHPHTFEKNWRNPLEDIALGAENPALARPGKAPLEPTKIVGGEPVAREAYYGGTQILPSEKVAAVKNLFDRLEKGELPADVEQALREVMGEKFVNAHGTKEIAPRMFDYLVSKGIDPKRLENTVKVGSAAWKAELAANKKVIKEFERGHLTAEQLSKVRGKGPIEDSIKRAREDMNKELKALNNDRKTIWKQRLQNLTDERTRLVEKIQKQNERIDTLERGKSANRSDTRFWVDRATGTTKNSLQTAEQQIVVERAALRDLQNDMTNLDRKISTIRSLADSAREVFNTAQGIGSISKTYAELSKLNVPQKEPGITTWEIAGGLGGYLGVPGLGGIGLGAIAGGWPGAAVGAIAMKGVRNIVKNRRIPSNPFEALRHAIDLGQKIQKFDKSISRIADFLTLGVKPLGKQVERLATKVGANPITPRAALTLYNNYAIFLDEEKTRKRFKDNPPDDIYSVYDSVTESLKKISADPAALDSKLKSSTEHLVPQLGQDMVDSISSIMKERVLFLAARIPTTITKNQYGVKLQPGRTEVEKFARYLKAVEDPLSIEDDIKNGRLTPEAIETLQQLYPRIYNQIKLALLDKLSAMKEPTSYNTRYQLDMFLGNVDGSFISMLQGNILNEKQEDEQKQKQQMTSLGRQASIAGLSKKSMDYNSPGEKLVS